MERNWLETESTSGRPRLDFTPPPPPTKLQRYGPSVLRVSVILGLVAFAIWFAINHPFWTAFFVFCYVCYLAEKYNPTPPKVVKRKRRGGGVGSRGRRMTAKALMRTGVYKRGRR